MASHPKMLIVGGIIFLLAVVGVAYYANQPIATTAQERAMNASLSSQAPAEASVGSRQAKITVPEVEDSDNMLALLDQFEPSQMGESSEENLSPITLEPEMEPVDSETSLAEERIEAPQQQKPSHDVFISEFLSAVHQVDIDTLLSMARGQGYDKLLLALPPPEVPLSEVKALFEQIQATNGRLISGIEYRVNLLIPREDGSPELVFRRDGEDWWLDDIIGEM